MKTPSIRLLALNAVAALSIVTAFATPAQADEESIIKYRQAVMTAIAAHGKAIDLNLKGKVDRGADVAGHAAALASLATSVGELFPEGSDFGETDALGEIWANMDDFQAKSKDLKSAADALAADTSAANYDALRDTCKACHKKYKAD